MRLPLQNLTKPNETLRNPHISLRLRPCCSPQKCAYFYWRANNLGYRGIVVMQMTFAELSLKLSSEGIPLCQGRIKRAVRDGFMPPAQRDLSGRRIYTQHHIRGLRKYHRAMAAR